MSERTRFQLSAAVFVILVKGDEICMLKRKATGWMDGSYSLPAGGLDAGETIRCAAMREAQEEVGVQINPASLAHIHTLHSRTDGKTWVGHFFRSDSWEGTPVLHETDKHSDLRWMPLIALPSNTIPYVRQALSCIAAGQPYSEYGWD